jgi:hypothetical protein
MANAARHDRRRGDARGRALSMAAAVARRAPGPKSSVSTECWCRLMPKSARRSVSARADRLRDRAGTAAPGPVLPAAANVLLACDASPRPSRRPRRGGAPPTSPLRFYALPRPRARNRGAIADHARLPDDDRGVRAFEEAIAVSTAVPSRGSMSKLSWIFASERPHPKAETARPLLSPDPIHPNRRAIARSSTRSWRIHR